MELTVQNVYGLLLRSKLLSFDEAKGMFARWQQEAKDAGNLAHFASWMVANKYLTEYQAQLLARGHAEGFFLNEYKILERLGKGRMAGVYKGQHQLGQIVAIKVLPPSKALDANFLGRFQREARLALLLKHPNIVRTFQTGTADGLYYIVMEYLEGDTLEEVLTRRSKLPPGEAVRLVYQGLQGLQHIHAQGLVHRDLKPANMMLVGSTPDSTLRATLKLLDIGLGRTLFDESAGDENLTSEGVLLGTPDYMSPEQARDPRTIDIRSDIYSLGCVLYHLLAGQPPFPDTNIISQMIRHATETPKPLKAFHSSVPDGLQQIVNWMMAKDAAQRYPTPERAAQALQVFLVAGAEQLAAPETDPRMRPYLTWLEEDADKQSVATAAYPTPAAKPASGTLPAAKPPKPPSGSSLPAAKPPSGNIPAVLPTKPSTKARAASEEHARTDKHTKKKHHPKPAAESPRDSERPRGTNAPPAALEPVEHVDVEPVPLDPPLLDGKLLRLNRRDVLLFGIGALAGALVTFVGALLAFKHRE
jgi:serine/threonine protein kinase